MTFQLVNHQLKHMFGGIQAEKNPSLQFLQNYQKKITKSMQKAQHNHKKIYQSIQTIKTNLQELSQNYLTLCKQNKHSSRLIKLLSSQINHFFQDISQESLSLGKKMQNKVQAYIPNLKKINDKFKSSAQTLEHYRTKVALLKKNIQKQPITNIKQDQLQRYQRNRQKLKKAQKQYDDLLVKVTKRYYQFNNEGLKDIYSDLVTTFSNIGGNVLQMSSKFHKHLIQNFSQREIALAKQLKLDKQISDNIQILQTDYKKTKSTALKNQIQSSRKQFFDYLCQQKQITNYLKSIIDKQILKIQTYKIKDAFIIKQQKKQNKNNYRQSFQQFQNIYNNKQLLNKNNIQIIQVSDQNIKQNQKCEDLIDVEQDNDVIQDQDDDDEQIYNNNNKIKSSPLSVQKSPSQISIEDIHQKNDKFKNNLQFFNKICDEKNKNKTKTKNNPKTSIKPSNLIEIITINNNNPTKNEISKLPILKSSQQFLNLHFVGITDRKQEKSKQNLKIHQQFTKKPQNAFNFDIFEKMIAHPDQTKLSFQKVVVENNKVQIKNNKNIDKKVYSSNINPVQILNTKASTLKTTQKDDFLNFDFFLPENHEKQKKLHQNINNLNNKPNFNLLSPKNNQINQLPSQLQKKKSQNNQFNLLNL